MIEKMVFAKASKIFTGRFHGKPKTHKSMKNGKFDE